MFFLVKFDDQSHYVLHSKKVKIIEGNICSVKWCGSSYKAYFISKSDSKKELEKLLSRLQTGLKSKRRKSKSRTSFHNLNESHLPEGSHCSTPTNEKPPAFGAGIRISAVIPDTQKTLSLTNKSTTSSSPPSGTSEIINAIGNDWMDEGTSFENLAQNNSKTSHTEKINAEDHRFQSQQEDVNNNEKDGNLVNQTPINAGHCYTESVNTENPKMHSLGDSQTGNNQNELEKRNIDRESTENTSISAITTSLDRNTSIVEETTEEDLQNDESEARDNSDYQPSNSITPCTSLGTNNESSINKSSIGLKVADGPPIDWRNIQVPVSKINEKRPPKKYFCPYCKTLQTKFARHLRLKHEKEPEVKKLRFKPPSEQRKLIANIRNYGNFIHNTDANLNTGILIPARRPQAKFNRNANNFIPCSHCKVSVAKSTLRIHYRKCNPKHQKGVRGQTVEGRKLLGYIHPAAKADMRRHIFPSFNGDEVALTIQYDELLVLFGNRLCEKYTLTHQRDMIRNQLRLLGRFFLTIKKIEEKIKTPRVKITDFASTFDPKLYNSTIDAIREVAEYNPQDKMFGKPYNATTLGTLLKKCARLLSAECIRIENLDGKKLVDGFMILFEDDFATRINKGAIEDQTRKRINKATTLPTKQEIQMLYNYVKTRCEEASEVLKSGFNAENWRKLNEGVLILVQMFNRRRAGEIERLLVKNYENHETIDKAINPDLYKKMSDDSREQAKLFVRLTIRGKLGRTVPVLLHTFLIDYIQTLLKYRIDAGVSPTNEYVFAVPHMNSIQKEYLRACPLMRKLADECGAKSPSLLRGTALRKHIATHTALLRLEEDRVSDLANFMGHSNQIHKDVYRVPNGLRDMTEVSRLLQAAMGEDEAENEDENTSDDDATEDATLPSLSNQASSRPSTASCNKPKKSALSQRDGRQISKKRRRIINSYEDDSLDEEAESSPSKRRSTSPYGKTKRVRWANQEIDLATKLFGDPCSLRKIPSLNECNAAVKKYDIFKNRTGQQLHLWFDNQRRAEKRKATYKHNKLSGSF